MKTLSEADETVLRRSTTTSCGSSLTTKGLNDAINGANDSVTVAQSIVSAVAATGEPVTATIKAAIEAAALFIKVSAAVLRALDRGRGVYITVFWPAAIFMQFIVAPTSR